MMNRSISVSGIELRKGMLRAMFDLVSLNEAPLAAAQDSPPCVPTAEAALAEAPPSWFGGFFFNFEDRMREAFPLGSCEQRLTEWMDDLGFGDAILDRGDAFFIDEPEEFERASSRFDLNTLIQIRRALRWSLIGHSHYSIAWTVDDQGRLVEFYPDTEIMHMDLP